MSYTLKNPPMNGMVRSSSSEDHSNELFVDKVKTPHRGSLQLYGSTNVHYATIDGLFPGP